MNGEQQFPRRTPVVVVICGEVEYESVVLERGVDIRFAAIGYGAHRAEIAYREPGVVIVPGDVVAQALRDAIAHLESGAATDSCEDCSATPVARCAEHHPAGPRALEYREILAKLTAVHAEVAS